MELRKDQAREHLWADTEAGRMAMQRLCRAEGFQWSRGRGNVTRTGCKEALQTIAWVST